MKVELRPYQRDGIRHLLSFMHACLFYDPGLGKTITALLSYVLIRQKKPGTKLILFAPLRIAQTVWQAEIEKWDDTRNLGLKVVLLHGATKKRRLWTEALEADITIVNYEGIKWFYHETMKNDFDWPWDIMCFDELSKMKDPGTQRSKMIRKLLGRCERRWGLTGTPAPNSLQELFGQMFVVDGGLALGTSKWRFEQTYFTSNPFTHDLRLKPGAEERIAARIAPIVHDLRAEDHLDMPERIDVWHDLRMSPAHKKIYDELEKESLLEFEASGQSVTAMTAGVLWGKLQQVCQGFLYTVSTADNTRASQRFDETKLCALEDIIEEAAGQSVLVMYRFQEDLVSLQDRFPEAVTLLRNNTDRVVREWNAKQIPILLANPQSAAHGLNLQAGGHIMVYYCLLYTSPSPRDA